MSFLDIDEKSIFCDIIILVQRKVIKKNGYKTSDIIRKDSSGKYSENVNPNCKRT